MSDQEHQGYLSNSLTYVYQPEIGQRTKYTAVYGQALLSTANTNLDGTGTIASPLRGGATAGTLVKTITLKAQLAVTRGMVRLYVEDGTPNTDIVAEIEIPAASQDNIQETYAISICVDYMLKADYYLKASIENGSQNVSIHVEGLEISYP